MNTQTADNENTRAALAEMRAEMRGMRETLQRVAGAMETLSAIEARNEARDERLGDHETRLRLLERSAWKVAGAVALAGAVGPAVAKSLGWL